GVNWADQGAISDNFAGFRPSVVLDNGTYRMWFSQKVSSGSNVGYATSSDGINWSAYNQSLTTCFFCITTENIIPVLAVGGDGAWDRPAVGDVWVIKDTNFKMWYTGGEVITPNNGGPESVEYVEGAIGYATSQ
ncbi:MAG TPA: hypothetical protein VGR50_06560, partial [Terriglobales bacterium]|nr:hypothetical protein [Terriglobales bacterium]